MLMPVKKVKIISASTVGSILGFSVSTFLATLLAKTAEGRVTDRRPARLGKHRAVPEARALQLGGSEGLLLDQFHEPVRCDPRAAQEVVSKSYAGLRDLIARNVEAEKPKMEPTVLAEMILTFFTGISMEQHLRVSRASINRKVEDFMKVVRKL